jgi:hypothetical protein
MAEFEGKEFTVQAIGDVTPTSLAEVFSGDQVKKTGGLTFWQGTQAAYDAITTKNPTTLYFITGA